MRFISNDTEYAYNILIAKFIVAKVKEFDDWIGFVNCTLQVVLRNKMFRKLLIARICKVYQNDLNHPMIKSFPQNSISSFLMIWFLILYFEI